MLDNLIDNHEGDNNTEGDLILCSLGSPACICTKVVGTTLLAFVKSYCEKREQSSLNIQGQPIFGVRTRA